MELPYEKIAITIPILLIAIELGVRATKITDFPLYEANNEIGYIPKPSQSGSFLHSHSWEFNSLSMGSGPFKPSEDIDTLLIGDSVVLGGNPYRQEERLGPRLQAEIQNAVWPISAGSWSLRNELIYLKQHPEVVKNIDNFIFILNSEDFDQASSWSCDITHPRSSPTLATAYVFKKYIYNWNKCSEPRKEFKVEPGDWKKELKNFLNDKVIEGRPVTFFLYPNKNEQAGNSPVASALEKYATDLLSSQNSSVKVYSVARDPRWSESFYRDSIHPTPEGTRILASILSTPNDVTELK